MCIRDRVWKCGMFIILLRTSPPPPPWPFDRFENNTYSYRLGQICFLYKMFATRDEFTFLQYFPHPSRGSSHWSWKRHLWVWRMVLYEVWPSGWRDRVCYIQPYSLLRKSIRNDEELCFIFWSQLKRCAEQNPVASRVGSYWRMRARQFQFWSLYFYIENFWARFILLCWRIVS